MNERTVLATEAHVAALQRRIDELETAIGELVCYHHLGRLGGRRCHACEACTALDLLDDHEGAQGE